MGAGKMGIEIKPVGRLDISKSKWTALRSYLDVREMQPAN